MSFPAFSGLFAILIAAAAAAPEDIPTWDNWFHNQKSNKKPNKNKKKCYDSHLYIEKEQIQWDSPK